VRKRQHHYDNNELAGALTVVWERAGQDGYFSHDKLAVITAHDWAIGEYKSCTQETLAETENEPQLNCTGLLQLGNPKTFKVRFYGLTYRADLKGKGDFTWRCKKNEGTDPAYTCDEQKTTNRN